MISLGISFRGVTQYFNLPQDTSFATLQSLIAEQSQIPTEYQKLISHDVGLIKVDKLPVGPDTPISQVFPTEASRKKIMLMGTPKNKLQELQETEVLKAQEHAKLIRHNQNMRRNARRAAKTPVNPDSIKYTFHKLQPLEFLPNPEKSLAFLRKIKEDRGVQAIMMKYKWSVPVLTELDPASNTTRESRLLGLNKNKGQIIELRLRTDDYQGWCHYKDVRKVLCHELTHNVYADHDSDFIQLCHKLEREVVELDPFGRSGIQLGDDVYDGPSSYGPDDFYDEGGFFGSTQALGTTSVDGNDNAGGTTTMTGSNDDEGLRSKMRRAAESRRNHKSFK